MANYTGKNKFPNCFVCSPTNPIGLHLNVTVENHRARTEFVPNENMSGLDGIMHGGFSLMIMDEVMFYAVESYEIDSVTLNSNVDFKSPAILGHTLTAEAWVAKRDGRKLFVEGELRDGDTVVVASKGLYYEMDMSSFLPDKEKKEITYRIRLRLRQRLQALLGRSFLRPEREDYSEEEKLRITGIFPYATDISGYGIIAST